MTVKSTTFRVFCGINIFHVDVVRFIYESQEPSKRDKNFVCHFLFSPHFDVICNLSLNRRMATRNLYVEHLMDSQF